MANKDFRIHSFHSSFLYGITGETAENGRRRAAVDFFTFLFHQFHDEVNGGEIAVQRFSDERLAYPVKIGRDNAVLKLAFSQSEMLFNRRREFGFRAVKLHILAIPSKTRALRSSDPRTLNCRKPATANPRRGRRTQSGASPRARPTSAPRRCGRLAPPF
jgi:hypothetical protein